MPVQLSSPQGVVRFQFDWSPELPEGVTLQRVDHTVPSPLTLVDQDTDSAGELSTVGVTGGYHGFLGNVTALATLSDGQIIPGSFPIRMFAGGLT